jgi:hypothetical protein
LKFFVDVFERWGNGDVFVHRKTESVRLIRGPWYGSCPMITTFTFSNGHASNAENICFGGGQIIFFAYLSHRAKTALDPQNMVFGIRLVKH